MARHVLLDTELVLLVWDPQHSAVVMTRTEAELPRDLDALRAFFELLVAAVGSINKPSNDFVIDARATMGRNDEAFETVKREFEHKLFGGFRNVSVVLQTEVGRLQVQRYNEDLSEQEMTVFPTVDAALDRPR